MKRSKNVTIQDATATIVLWCKVCGKEETKRSGVGKFICASCVAKMVSPPENKNARTEKRPRGWHKKARFVSESGKIYEYGRIIDEDTATVCEGSVDGTGDGTDPKPTSSIAEPPKRKRGRPRKTQ